MVKNVSRVMFNGICRVYTGTVCHGKFIPASGVAILNFFQSHSTVLVVQRVVDADSIYLFITCMFLSFYFFDVEAMAVCIIEIDEKQIPTLQYGNMYRIDPTLYRQ